MKKESKILSMFAFSIILIGFFAGIVSAQLNPNSVAGQIDSLIQGIVDSFSPVLSRLLGSTGTAGVTEKPEIFLAKVLFLILIFAVVWYALGKIETFQNSTALLVTISIVVSVLSVRFITSEAIINSIILPYSTVGIAISVGFPFIIYFMLINLGIFKDAGYKTARRIAWAFFAVIFIALWATRNDLDAKVSSIYIFTAILAFTIAWLDGTIQKFLHQLREEKIAALGRAPHLGKLHEQLTKLHEDFTKEGSAMSREEYLRKKRELERKIIALGRY